MQAVDGNDAALLPFEAAILYIFGIYLMGILPQIWRMASETRNLLTIYCRHFH